MAAGLTVAGIVAIAVGGELVALRSDGLVTTIGLGAGLVGMVITPAAIEAEEIIRQVIPARRGYADVSAGNVVGTVLYFSCSTWASIALLTPVAVPNRVRAFRLALFVGGRGHRRTVPPARSSRPPRGGRAGRSWPRLRSDTCRSVVRRIAQALRTWLVSKRGRW